ncbi:unnamed protein product [Hymenolepis diminuta]|uniref:Uncharacterized protein n=1 Tax=Hymenolepis diminuta TaxID=6216 RepID=A0A564YIG2_HYMDI|nr:unnamed protein product [Hymenolepis diminuta]
MKANARVNFGFLCEHTGPHVRRSLLFSYCGTPEIGLDASKCPSSEQSDHQQRPSLVNCRIRISRFSGYLLMMRPLFLKMGV